MSRKYLMLLIALFVLIFLAGCGRVTNKQKNIYDNEEQIAQEGDTMTYLSRIGGIDSVDANDQVSFKFDGFYGTDTLWIVSVKSDCYINLNYDVTIDDGEYKAVLITEEKEVELIFEGSVEGTKSIKLDKGKYRIKVVGKGAEGKIKMSIDNNNDIEIRKSDTN